jgi:hypothetical protein
MTNTIYKTKKISLCTTVFCEIEETEMNIPNFNFSILVYDEFGEWVEKFSDTYEEAVLIADKLFLKVCNQY